jgi:hypothetical protein
LRLSFKVRLHFSRKPGRHLKQISLVRLIIAISAAVFATGTWWLYEINSAQSQVDAGNVSDTKKNNTVTNSQEPKQVLQRGGDGPSAEEVRHLAGAARSDAASQNASLLSEPQLNEGDQISNPESQGAQSQTDDPSIPEGAAFPISESIRAECDRLLTLKLGCADASKVLKKIEEERTDDQWASVMEGRLREAYGQDPGIRIRALACRSSACAVESEGSNVLSRIWGSLGDDLFPDENIGAYEDVEGRGTLGVSLLVFARERQELTHPVG